MTAGFIAIGHGRAPSGKFEPGAVDARDIEHNRNALVANVVTAALRRSGLEIVSEVDLPSRTDPNYRGSLVELNNRRCAWGAEIHHDWRGGYTGIAVLFGQDNDRTLGAPIVAAARNFAAWVATDAHAKTRAHNAARLVNDPHHSFLGARVPTVIVEAGRVDDAEHARWDLFYLRGELIAQGLIDGARNSGFTDRRYVGP